MTSRYHFLNPFAPALRTAWSALSVLSVLSCAGSSRAGRPRLTLTDDWGRTVGLAAPAQRIVSLAPATTELAFALGLGNRLVGRTTWCDWPPAARAVPDVGNGIGPNVEAVASRRPDLVLLYASEADRPALGRFEALGIPVLVLRLDRAADVRRAALLVSRAAGDSAAGDSLVAGFDAALARARHPAGPRPAKVYVAVQADPPITVGRGSYLSEIIEAAGGRNVFDDIAAGSGPVSLEAIVQRDPDVIVVLGSDTTADPGLAARPAWRAVRAVREGRVLVLDGRLYGRPSPRMPEAVQGLARKLAALGGAR